jgi:MOSC domain-containing protein YiiM
VITGIYVTPEPKGRARSVDSVEAIAGRGLAGDRYANGEGTWFKEGKTGQEVTLIEDEAIVALATEHGISLAPGDTRRNLVTRGVVLADLLGKQFRIGDVVCVGVRDCPPCAHLDGLTTSGVRAGLEGRGGLRAEIVTGGTIRVGDPIVAL